MKIPLPGYMIKLASGIFDIEATGESARVDTRSYEYGFVLSKLADICQSGNCYDRKSLLDIGCAARINPVPAFACNLGWNVTGIDLRSWNYKHKLFTMVTDNFVDHNFAGQFDVITAVSTIEHMGLTGRYGISTREVNLDKAAIYKISSLLSTGGKLLFTVPFGKYHHVSSNMRIYDIHSIDSLLSCFGKYSDISWHVIEVDNSQTIMIEVIS